MKPELLAPAGDLEKVRVACLYGADAVYVGARELSLRARASKFSLASLKDAIGLAHAYGKKLYVTANIVPHDEDLKSLDEFLLALEVMEVDAIICSDPFIIDRAKTLTKLKIHVSTQVSVANSRLANFYAAQGASRIVLARELTTAEIKAIRNNTDTELEVFIHGGMCVSYSGRCTLSNLMTRRDANRGGCAHSCRWLYDLYKNHELIANDFAFASRDLSAIRQLPELMAIGVDSFKIEGRMKSLHYIASVVKTYRMLIDDHWAKRTKPLTFYTEELIKAENRSLGPGFLEGTLGVASQLYQDEPTPPSQDFIGVVAGYDRNLKEVIVEQRNHFRTKEVIEVLRPQKDTLLFTVEAIKTEAGELLDAARHPLERVRIPLACELEPYDLLRRVKS